MELQPSSIELRSEKARSLIGQIPSLLYRKGIMVISIVMILFLAAILLIPYPDTIIIESSMGTIPEYSVLYAQDDGYIEYIDEYRGIEKGETAGIIYSNITKEIKAPTSGELVPLKNNRSFVKKGDIIGIITPMQIDSIYFYSYLSNNIARNLRVKQQVLIEREDSDEYYIGVIERLVKQPNGQTCLYVQTNKIFENDYLSLSKKYKSKIVNFQSPLYKQLFFKTESGK